MGATKTGDDDVRWMSNNASIDPTLKHWEHDPRRDIGQFYAKRENVSCILIGPSIFPNFRKWGHKSRIISEHTSAYGFCESPIGLIERDSVNNKVQDKDYR